MLINPLAIGLLKEPAESVASQIAMWDETGTDQQGVPVRRQGSAGGRNAPPEGGDLFRLGWTSCCRRGPSTPCGGPGLFETLSPLCNPLGRTLT